MFADIQDAFKTLKEKRRPYEDTWDAEAYYTSRDMYLPDDLRDDFFKDPADMAEGDSLGADCLANMVSVISKVAFPDGAPFFELQAKPGSPLSKLGSGPQRQILRDAAMEGTFALNALGLTESMYYMIGRPVCLGTSVYRIPQNTDERFEVYEMNDAVVKRTFDGRVLCIIVRDKMHPMLLPQHAKEQVMDKIHPNRQVSLFTAVVLRDDGKYHTRQAVGKHELTLDPHFFTMEESPYQVASLYLPRGRDYGVGVVFRYLKWLHAANVYRDANTDAAAIGSLINWGMAPGAGVTPEEWGNRQQGQGFALKAGDVFPIVADVSQQYAMTERSYQELVQMLQKAFMTYIPRQGERVTAEEVRTTVSQLESGHPGLYSFIGNQIQYPIAKQALKFIKSPDLKKYVSQMQVKLPQANEALGRNSELQSVLSALNQATIFNSLPPDLRQRLDMEAALSVIWSDNNLKAKDFILSQEQVNQQAQAQGPQQGVQQQQSFTQNDPLLSQLNKPMI